MINYEKSFQSALPANFDGLFVWDYICEVLPRGIMPSDIDAVIEIGGIFLMFETKDDNKQPSVGQRLLMRALIDLPNLTLMMLWGKSPEDVKRLEIYDGLGNPRIIDPAASKDVQAEVVKWVDHAQWLFDKRRQSSQLRPHPSTWRFTFWE